MPGLSSHLRDKDSHHIHCAFLIAVEKHLTKESFLEEGFMSSRFEDAVQRGGEAPQLKCEATGHSASALRQHLETNVSSLPPVFFLYSAGTEPTGGEDPCSRKVFPLPLIL